MIPTDSLVFSWPLGSISISGNEEAITAIKLSDELPAKDSELSLLRAVKEEFIAYFSRQRKEFTFPIMYAAPPFHSKVYQQLLKVAYGETISYQALAERAGSPLAYRAVGQANHNNPLPLAIPCHRVIGKDRSMVGFESGIWRKEALLALEAGCEYMSELEPGVRRIYSFGWSAPAESFDSSRQPELVKLEAGTALLEVAGSTIRLQKGDEYLIPALAANRVLATSWDCIWLCRYL